MDYKGVYQIGSLSVNAGTTIAWPTLFLNTSGWSMMDVLISAGTLIGSPWSFSIQENFSGEGYLETASSGSLSSSGVYWIVHDAPTAATGVTVPSNIKAASPLLGKGREKRIVCTLNNNGTLVANFYFIPYQI